MNFLYFGSQTFVSDFTGTTQEGIFAGNDAILLNEAISEHLLRQGHVDVAEMLINVCKSIQYIWFLYICLVVRDSLY